MKKFFKIVLYTIAGFFCLSIIVAIFSDSKPGSTDSSSKDSQAALAANSTNLPAKPAFSEEELKKMKAEMVELKKKFTVSKDDFKDITWYQHKTWGTGWLDRKGLFCTLRSDGWMYLSSNYHSDDWLFHTQIQVKIGNAILNSPVVETHDKNNHQDNNVNGIYEVIGFLESDGGILNGIAESSTKEIKVRFIGREFNDDIVLSNKDKQAIKDCVELSNLIKTLKDAGV